VLWAELELFLLEFNIAYEIVEKIEKKLKSEIINHKFSRFSLKDKTTLGLSTVMLSVPRFLFNFVITLR
jgi:signal recognition particle GTPase